MQRHPATTPAHQQVPGGRKLKPENRIVLAGVALMLGGNFLFTLNDALSKLVLDTFSVGQVLLIRAFGALVFLAPMICRQEPAALLRPERPRLQFVRAWLTLADTGLFLAAVAYLPLADVMTFYMAGPIYVAVISHFLLKETLGWRSWIAIAIGFGGVLIALRPSPAMFSLPSIFALVGSLTFSCTLILNRVLRATNDAILVTWQNVAMLIGGLLLSIGAWRNPTPAEFFQLAGIGIVACVAHLLITRAMKFAPASILAPLQYSLLLWSILFGFVFFGDVPDAYILSGSAVIAASGVFLFHRKKRRNDLAVEDSIPRDGH